MRKQEINQKQQRQSPLMLPAARRADNGLELIHLLNLTKEPKQKHQPQIGHLLEIIGKIHHQQNEKPQVNSKPRPQIIRDDELDLLDGFALVVGLQEEVGCGL